jgi:hypothetical protein
MIGQHRSAKECKSYPHDRLLVDFSKKEGYDRGKSIQLILMACILAVIDC